MIAKPPGIEDIFPDKTDKWNFIIQTAREEFKRHNYKEIIIPIMEYTEVFARGLGDETDIVSKEMFTFEDRGGRDLTLRPEGTASVVRAYVENGDYNRLATCKFFYVGPMFRAEKPQRGRLRQFNQFGAELFGSNDPFYDYEIISMINNITINLGITNYELLINSIGCPACRGTYLAELKQFYENQQENLCDDCKRRLTTNTLRLLDCKKKTCAELKKQAPRITEFLDDECKNHYTLVKEYLNANAITYREDPYLVRGLDYYSKTTFEFITTELGGQNAFAAGGRYNSLVEQFGGKPTPAVGFAAGIERLFLMLEKREIPSPGINIYIIHTGEETLKKAITVATDLRKAGFSVDLDPETKGFKAQFKKAEREQAKFALIIGENELQSGECGIKNQATGEQQNVAFDSLLEYFTDNSH